MSYDIMNAISSRAIPPYPYAYPLRSSHRPLDGSYHSQEKIWKDESLHTSEMVNLYIHFPFCRYKCGFCNLYSIANNDPDIQNSYIDALCRQIRLSCDLIAGRKVKTVFFGGGTPMLISEGNFEKLVGSLSDLSPTWSEDVEEFCIEASPDAVIEGHKSGLLTKLLAGGINRINLGIQSFKRSDIATIGRDYGADVNTQAVDILNAYGVRNISADLIAGFQGQQKEDWLESVRQLVQLRAHTASIYHLRVRPDSKFGRDNTHSQTVSSDYYEWYDEAVDLLLDSGYEQDTNVRFIIPGRGGYIQQWYQFESQPILGLGAGARSYTNVADYIVGGSTKPCEDEIHQYISQTSQGLPPIAAGIALDDEERARRRLVLNLYRFDIANFERLYGKQFEWIYKETFKFLEDEGMLVRRGSIFSLTKLGCKYRDIIAWHFFSDRVRRLDKEFYTSLEAQNRAAVV